jgi:hypothetical protein
MTKLLTWAWVTSAGRAEISSNLWWIRTLICYQRTAPCDGLFSTIVWQTLCKSSWVQDVRFVFRLYVICISDRSRNENEHTSIVSDCLPHVVFLHWSKCKNWVSPPPTDAVRLSWSGRTDAAPFFSRRTWRNSIQLRIPRVLYPPLCTNKCFRGCH